MRCTILARGFVNHGAVVNAGRGEWMVYYRGFLYSGADHTKA